MAHPTPRLLRGITDETVVRAFIDGDRMTRAQAAAATGLSKPAVAQSVERLLARGLVIDTGERTATRGGVGTYYALAEGAGLALAVAIAPEGLVAELLAPNGRLLAREELPVARRTDPDALARGLHTVLAGVCAGRPAEHITVATVSAADPVDRGTGRLVHLPDAPFLVGDLDPVAVIRPHATGQVLVDNDVNWAARAERAARLDAGDEDGADDFTYLYLGAGLGCAVVSDGQVRRGHHGLAGEIAHLPTADGAGNAIPFTAVFDDLGVRASESSGLDVPALVALLGSSPVARSSIVEGVAGVLASAIGLTDPAFVVLGGTWGPIIAPDVGDHLTRGPRRARVTIPRLTDEAALAGARADAITRLTDAIAQRARC